MTLPRVRGAALLAIAALVGLIVSLVLIYTVERRAAVTTVPVLVVTKSVTKGTTLQANMVEVVQWPAHLKSFEALKAPEAALGRLTRVDLYDGEPLLDGKLRRRGDRADDHHREHEVLNRGDAALRRRGRRVQVDVHKQLPYRAHYVDRLTVLQSTDSHNAVSARLRTCAYRQEETSLTAIKNYHNQ